MKTGVSTASLFLRKSNKQALPLLEELGVKTVEVFLTSFSEYGQPFADTLKACKGGLEINSVHALNTQFEPELFNRHPLVKADAYSMLEKVLETAKALDCPYYTLHGTSRFKRASRLEGADNFPRMIECFSHLLDFCKARGVQLCLENVEWSTYNRVGVFSRLSESLPNLLGVLDVKQARISGYPYEAYLSEMGGRIAYAHLSDFKKEGGMCLPGKGDFDFDTLVKRLLDVGFNGALLLEVYNGDYDDVSELKTACEYLDEILYKNNCLNS